MSISDVDWELGKGIISLELSSAPRLWRSIWRGKPITHPRGSPVTQINLLPGQRAHDYDTIKRPTSFRPLVDLTGLSPCRQYDAAEKLARTCTFKYPYFDLGT